MPRVLKLAASMLVGLLSLSSGAASAEEKTWNRDFTVGRQPTVRIETDDARVTIRSWKEPRVEVRVAHRGKAEGLFIGHRRPRVEIGQHGNEVRVRARMEGSSAGIIFNSTEMIVEVWLPRTTDLSVDTQDGSVSLENVEGSIDLVTQDGPLEGRGLKGRIRVKSQDGGIQLDDMDGSLLLETQDGQSLVRGRFDVMDVESADGGVEIEAQAGSKLREDWSLSSQDGGIRLRIPGDLAATIDARAQDGNLSFDIPVQLQGRVRQNALVGDLNGGGPVLRLRTRDGSIRVMPID